MKIDMSKAYDRVNWNLKAVLTVMNFDSKWIKWIMKCVSSGEYTLLINGRDRKSTRLNSSHRIASRMPSSA